MIFNKIKNRLKDEMNKYLKEVPLNGITNEFLIESGIARGLDKAIRIVKECEQYKNYSWEEQNDE